MNPTLLNPIFIFLNGAAFMAAAVCSLFFVRFWAKSRERLFLVFGSSFALLSVERIVFLLKTDLRVEDHASIYMIRLLSFLMILGGIWDKNRNRRVNTIRDP